MRLGCWPEELLLLGEPRTALVVRPTRALEADLKMAIRADDRAKAGRFHAFSSVFFAF